MKKRRIYLVDEDFSARKGLTRLLAAAGHEVEAFPSFEELSQIQTFDNNACLVLDCCTAELSTVDLQTVFVKKTTHLPVIILSVRDDKESFDKALAAKAAGFFRKPVDGPALLDAIDWAVKTHGQRPSTYITRRNLR